MKSISINYLAHLSHRKIFFKYISYYLYKIKKENKKNISFIIHYTNNESYWNNEVEKLLVEGIDAVAIQYMIGLNYMSKVRAAIQSPLEFSISVDEDTLLSNHAWDSLIESTYLLNNPNILLVTPLMSIEVGSVDLFIEKLCGKQLELEKLYLEVDFTKIGNLWGVDFTSLNEYTLGRSIWNYEEFYNKVETIPHYYKGIHPIRISKKAQIKVVSLILDNYEEFTKFKTYSEPVMLDRPYFTNHTYLLRTSTWKNILKDKSLVKDDFDEVPLNLYRRKHNYKIAYLTECFGLHAAYSTIGKEDQNEVEQTLLRGLDEKINCS